MNQLTFFDRPPEKRRIERAEPAPGKADTSRAAAESMRGQPALSQRERVMIALLACGSHGATREELAELAEIRLASVCGRVNELLRLRMAAEIEETRTTVSGRQAAVVVATPH